MRWSSYVLTSRLNWIIPIQKNIKNSKKELLLSYYLKPVQMIHRKLSIGSVSELAFILGTNEDYLLCLAKNVERYYREWTEPKESGGTRKFTSPQGRLKKTQKDIHRLLSRIDFGINSHYGIKKRSCLTNAKVHKNTRIKFTLDLKSFFPSVRPERIYTALIAEQKCSPEVAILLTKLVSVNYELPQGAPTSTGIANIVTLRLQRRLNGLANKWALKFSIYADDITFSGNFIKDDFVFLAKKIIRDEGFKIHSAKGGVFNKWRIQVSSATG